MIWYVLFMDYGHLQQSAWARIWTKKGFRHVMAVAKDPELEKWLFVEPQPGQCIVRAAEPYDVDKFIVFCRKQGKALQWTEKHNVTHGYAIRTCVSMLKDVIGFHGFCLTPYGLYRAMIKQGAKPAFEEIV